MKINTTTATVENVTKNTESKANETTTLASVNILSLEEYVALATEVITNLNTALKKNDKDKIEELTESVNNKVKLVNAKVVEDVLEMRFNSANPIKAVFENITYSGYVVKKDLDEKGYTVYSLNTKMMKLGFSVIMDYAEKKELNIDTHKAKLSADRLYNNLYLYSVRRFQAKTGKMKVTLSTAYRNKIKELEEITGSSVDIKTYRLAESKDPLSKKHLIEETQELLNIIVPPVNVNGKTVSSFVKKNQFNYLIQTFSNDDEKSTSAGLKCITRKTFDVMMSNFLATVIHERPITLR